MRSLVAASAAALAFGAAAPASDFAAVVIPADANGQVTFSTPSNNIECFFTPDGGTPVYKPPGNKAELQCDRAAPVYIRFAMGASGRAEKIVDPGEQPCCSTRPVLAYGQEWHGGPFVCTSAAEGLACERRDGHGFFVSRARAEVH